MWSFRIFAENAYALLNTGPSAIWSLSPLGFSSLRPSFTSAIEHITLSMHHITKMIWSRRNCILTTGENIWVILSLIIEYFVKYIFINAQDQSHRYYCANYLNSLTIWSTWRVLYSKYLYFSSTASCSCSSLALLSKDSGSPRGIQSICISSSGLLYWVVIWYSMPE